MTYIATQGQSCISFAIVTSWHSHQFEAHAEASLEKKHQHLVVGWDTSISRRGARAPAVRHVDCGHISETFDSDNFSCALFEVAVGAAYEDYVQIISGRNVSDKILQTKWIPQGQCLSPHLYSIFTADMPPAIKHETVDIRTHRPLSRRLDRCDRMMQKEGNDSRKLFTLKIALRR